MKYKIKLLKVYMWIDFFNLLFWLSILGFLINYSNFLFIFLFSEITWIILYSYSSILGIYLDDLNLLSNTFFSLGLAGIEFAIGFLLIISFKKFNVSYDLSNNNSFLKINSSNFFKNSLQNLNNI